MVKRKFLSLKLIILCVIVTSCLRGDYNEEDLIGNWTVSKWEVESTGQLRENQMDMHFDEDKTYVVDYGSELEKGRYWVANDYLHTVEENRSEKKVKIIKLNKDTLEFQMNRGGELEYVLLTKG